MILITGAEGLIGRRLALRLEEGGQEVRRFDVRRSSREDVTNGEALAQAVEGADGVVHLAALSRVVWAEREPERCWAVNVDALRELLQLCRQSKRRPWIVFASSREVYGDAQRYPVTEDAELRPLNVYARSKCEGERMMREAAEAGLTANIVRLSNVYGCPLDHHDRVTMAFARAAAFGGEMRLEGAENAFDFTALDDVAEGLWLLIRACAAGERLPPIHLVGGRETTLRQLAELAQQHALQKVRISEATPRDYDVSRFVGDPARAARLLGWTAETDISVGLPRLIRAIVEAEGDKNS